MSIVDLEEVKHHLRYDDDSNDTSLKDTLLQLSLSLRITSQTLLKLIIPLLLNRQHYC